MHPDERRREHAGPAAPGDPVDGRWVDGRWVDERWVDERVRLLPLVTDDEAARRSDSRARQALFEEIVAMDPTAPTTGSPTDTPAAWRPRPRLRRRGLLVAAALTVVALAASGWVAVQELRSDQLAVACVLDPAHTGAFDGQQWVGTTWARTLSTAPVENCERAWQQENGEPIPPMTEYRAADGAIVVIPDGWEVPTGLVELADGEFAFDARVAELEEALHDMVDGLGSDCFSTQEAQQLVAGELDRLGFAEDWSVTTGDSGTAGESEQADGTTSCARAVMSQDERRVELRSSGEGEEADGDEGGQASEGDVPTPTRTAAAGSDPDPLPDPRRQTPELRAALAGQCLTVTEVGELAREVYAEAYADDSVRHSEIVDATRTCASVEVTMGGLLFVTVRGPETVD